MPTPAELKRLADSFDWDGWTKKIRAAIAEDYEAVALDQAERAADQYDLEFSAADPFVDRWFTRYLAERVTQIRDTTRDMLRDELQSALDAGDGDSMQELGGRILDAVDGAYGFSPARALTIARTETATAYNHGALLTYGQNDIDEVEVSDGDGDDECAEADGQIWTVDEAMADPIAHPNCVRSFAPVVKDKSTGGGADDEGDDAE